MKNLEREARFLKTCSRFL